MMKNAPNGFQNKGKNVYCIRLHLNQRRQNSQVHTITFIGIIIGLNRITITSISYVGYKIAGNVFKEVSITMIPVNQTCYIFNIASLPLWFRTDSIIKVLR